MESKMESKVRQRSISDHPFLSLFYPICSQFSPVMQFQWEAPNKAVTKPVDQLRRFIAQTMQLGGRCTSHAEKLYIGLYNCKPCPIKSKIGCRFIISGITFGQSYLSSQQPCEIEGCFPIGNDMWRVQRSFDRRLQYQQQTACRKFNGHVTPKAKINTSNSFSLQV